MPSREVSAEAEVERLTRALTTQTVRADGAEAEAVRLTAERDAALAQAEELTRALTALRVAAREWLDADLAAASLDDEEDVPEAPDGR